LVNKVSDTLMHGYNREDYALFILDVWM